jgi:hypothetical protein
MEASRMAGSPLGEIRVGGRGGDGGVLPRASTRPSSGRLIFSALSFFKTFCSSLLDFLNFIFSKFFGKSFPQNFFLIFYIKN